ncbi:hypothetical protein [Microbacterium capsulatum]|uniref:Uncharacterized protein n=1 Tax=Microbacterium capsulatum TaxID=3041921 RepID=A0ABU0XF51_9MICO|nr:hypothetical protein [Microbacterium sp. ASV81]MDQ4213752.1 hypothetical protein [Microbacterium sp. ASV81]
MPELVFTKLHFSRPITQHTIVDALTRLTSTDVPRPVILELHAEEDGIRYIFGCAPTAVQRLKRLLRGYFPGASFSATTRPDVAAVSRVVAHPAVVPLEADPEQVVASLYQALAARRGAEHVALQVVLGRTHAARTLPPKLSDPFQQFASIMLDGARTASTDARKRMEQRTSSPTLATTVRVGVTADTQKRTASLIWEVFGALQLMETPGVRLSLNHDTSSHWQSGTGRAAFDLSAAELVPLLGWPIGERDYPGVPGLHPRLLPVPEIVSRTASVFATGTAPGSERLIGIDPKSRLQHLVALGPTGSGKSTLLEHLILSDIAAGRACCVIEPKKQLVDRILDTAPLETAGRIVVLDATDRDAPVGFNPLDVGDRDPDIVVDGILAALAAVFHDTLGPRTEYLIQGALLSLARAGQRRGVPYTLIDLPRLLTDDAFRRPVVAAVQDDPTLAAFWAEYDDMRPAQRAAVIAPSLNRLRKIVLRQPLVRVLGQSQPRFRLRDIFRDKKTVLVPLNDALLGEGASKLLGSLIVAELFLATTERAAEKDPMKRPGMIFIDEVQNYLHLPVSIENAMSVFRSYGVGVHVAHQYREQLPAGMRSGLDANAGNKICFALDTDDAQAMAKRAPSLTASDFESLPKHHIYARLIAGTIPTTWCSATVLPPAPLLGHADAIREASREQFGALPAIETPSETATVEQAPRRSHQKARQA